ncbi:MAG: glycosyltransferase family 4 protein [Bacilli bacterium]
MKKIKINMLSKADSIDGQGVGSAFLEQSVLIKEIDNYFSVDINSMKNNYQIRHVHSINPEYYLRMDKSSINVCYVHFVPKTLEGSIALPKFYFSFLKKYIIKFYSKADELVVVNPIFIKDLIELGLAKDKITYIPNYVSKDKFYKLEDKEVIAIRKEYKIPLHKFVVLGVGQVQTRKGISDFVAVAKENPDQLFIRAGGFSFGNLSDGHKDLKKIMDNPPANVKFLGIIPREEMNKVYNASDVLFVPSFNELFPMAILEAINSSIPLLVRDLELYKDVIFDNYLKGKSVKEFSTILTNLQNDKTYYKEAQDLSLSLSLFYSKEHVSLLWKDYYTSLLIKYPNRKNVKSYLAATSNIKKD